MFSRIALAEDLPEENLRRGDVAVIVEYYEGRTGQEPSALLARLTEARRLVACEQNRLLLETSI